MGEICLNRKKERGKYTTIQRQRALSPNHSLPDLRTVLLAFFFLLFFVLQMLQVLAHAAAWALTEYTRVILLEDNMLVMENIDDLFECSGVCAGAAKRTGHTRYTVGLLDVKQ